MLLLLNPYRGLWFRNDAGSVDLLRDRITAVCSSFAANNRSALRYESPRLKFSLHVSEVLFDKLDSGLYEYNLGRRTVYPVDSRSNAGSGSKRILIFLVSFVLTSFSF